MIAGGFVAPLNWKVPPHLREPAAGYASRLAALNGVDFVDLMRGSGISARAVHGGRKLAVTDVAILGGLDNAAAEMLARHTPYRGTKDALPGIGREKLGWTALRTASFRFCPHCVAQDLVEAPHDVPVAARPWLRLEWMIEQIRSCSTHSVRLAETTRAVNGIADFSKTMSNEVLPRLDHLRAAAEPAGSNDFEEWVRRRLDGTKDPDSWLDGMSMHAAIAACEWIGLERLGDVRAHRSRIDDAEMAAISHDGYRVAAAGVPGIERFLDTLVARGQAQGSLGMKPTYGCILTGLEDTLADPEHEAFRTIVRRHIMENIPLPAGSLVLGDVLAERRLHTISSAAEASATSRHTLRAIFARSGITSQIGDPNQPRLTVRVDQFEGRLREFAAALKIDEVVGAIGIPKKHLLELIARGMVPTLFGSREVNKARHRVARADIDAFMNHLFQGSELVDVPNARQVPFGRACFIASTNIGDVVGLILAGRLGWKGRLRDGRRYTDMLVDADEVTRVLQGDAPQRRSLTKTEIGEEMEGMRLDVVGAMIQSGRLISVEEFCPTTRRRLRLVDRDSFEAFKARYVTLTEICHMRNIDARVAVKHLAAAGCIPAFDRASVGNAIYERTACLDAALSGCPRRGAVWAASHPRHSPRGRT
ncbi:TniQ family protein [Methylorubrum populi]